MAQLTIQQAFDLALQHHQAGRLHEADRLYRQVLIRQPEHSIAMHHLGLIAHQLGQNEVAVDLIRRAIALNPNYAEAHSNLGVALFGRGQLDEAIVAYRRAIALRPNLAEAHGNLGNALKDKGQLDEAIAAYRQAIALNPNLPEVHNNLGNALKDKGQLDEAIAAYRQAIALNPNLPEAHSNLGIALTGKGQLDEAIAACRQAIALKPNLPEAHSNLGNALKHRGQLDEAIAACRQAIALQPNFPEAHNNLGNALRDQGQLDEAIAAVHQAIVLKPDYAEAHCNLGNALRDQGQLDEAIAACRQAIALKPNLPEAHNNLGNALLDRGQLDEAIAAFRRAIALKPNLPEAHSNLGNALKDKGQFDEAIAAYRQAIALRPNGAEAHNNLGNVLKDKGQLDEAIAAFRQAIALRPNFPDAHSNFLYALYFDTRCSQAQLLAEHRAWAERQANPLKRLIRPHDNDRNPNRRLRIGYVSPNFWGHCQALFTVPLFSRHDHQQFEIYCYSDVKSPDAFTARLRAGADVWRSIVGMNDEKLAELIRRDQIDILVDLTLHMARNRMLLFARKPAPVQVTWLGYPGTTGLETMDYRLTDPYLDPPGQTDAFYTEKSIRLPNTFWCIDPQAVEMAEMPGVNPLPALHAGHVTFGCLNNFCKVNQPLLELWSRVLDAVPGSRMVLLAPPGSPREWISHTLGDRVDFVSRDSRQNYLKFYDQIDLGLDTLPYNGHTTSIDSLWMGVPVVTLIGKTVVGRAGFSQLSNVGLADLAATTPEQFVQLAAKVAADLPRLAELRRTLRDRTRSSPLMDAQRFARDIESAYRQMWAASFSPHSAKDSDSAIANAS